MSYRDETLVLRERLLTLDVEHAQLEGTAQGLHLRSALAEDDAETLRRDLRIEKAKGSARRVTYRLVAGVVGLVSIGLFCLVSGGLFHACANVSEVADANDAFRGERRLEGCHVEVSDAFAGPCTAKAWCDEGVVWEGRGTCDEGIQGVQFWSDENAAGERFTYVRGSVARAVYRPAEGESVVFRLPGGRGL